MEEAAAAVAAEQKVDLVTRLDVIKSAIMSEKRHGSFKVAPITISCLQHNIEYRYCTKLF